MDSIDTINYMVVWGILIALVFFLALVYWRNTVLELRKLNKEFRNFHRWMYFMAEGKKEQAGAPEADSASPDAVIKEEVRKDEKL